MKSIGGLMVLLGAGSFVLGFIGMEFTLLMWIDNWGPSVGWALRGVLIVVGALLLLFGPDEEAPQAEESAAP